MTLIMKEKDSMFKDRFLVRDEQGDIVYIVEGKTLSLSKKLTIYDSQDRPLAVVQKKPFSMTTKFSILVEDEEVAELSKETNLLNKSYYKVEGPNWTVDGEIWDREYNIRRNMNVIAKIRTPLFGGTDTYKIDIQDKINPLMVVAVVTAIDCIIDAEGDEAVQANNTKK